MRSACAGSAGSVLATFTEFSAVSMSEAVAPADSPVTCSPKSVALQAEFDRVLEKIDSNHRWFLGERIALLWRQTSQSYYDYLGVVLSKVRTMPDLLRCKLADRLDNTMDIAIQRIPTEQNVFFELAF